MKFAMCNEFCEGWTLDQAIELAARTGYEGVEVAPFTLAPTVGEVSHAERNRLRRRAADAGVELIGIHWLLASPPGLHINHPDPHLRRKTCDYLRELLHFCADIGGDRMVVGSPKQRNVVAPLTYQQAWDYAKQTFEALLPDAERRGVTLCLEPLARSETDFITTVAEGRRMVEAIDNPRFRLHIDVKAMCDEQRPLDQVIAEAQGVVGHLHVNDANRNGPGWGQTDYEHIVRALRTIGYDDYASVEVFDFSFGAETIARKSLEFLRRVF